MVLWQQHPSVASFMTQGVGRLGQGGKGGTGKEDFWIRWAIVRNLN